MKVGFSPTAEEDLTSLQDYIAEHSGFERASNYTKRIQDYCLDLALSPGIGTLRDDLRPGLRTVGFERRLVIAFYVTAETIFIDRILYGGRELD